MFAIDPERAPYEPGYRDVYATEARTPGEGRWLWTYLATGTYNG